MAKKKILKTALKKVATKVKTAAAKKPKLAKALKAVTAVSTGGVSLLADKKSREKLKKVASNPKLKKIVKGVAAVSTGGVSLLADKKNREKVANAAKKVGAAASTAAKKVANAGKKVATVALFLPFMPLALIFLKRRGIKPSKKPDEIITQVHNEMSKKSFGLVPGGDSFEYAADVHEFGYADEAESYGIVPVTPGMVMAVIGFLKSIFQSIKAKRAKGEALSADEQEILNQAPEIEQNLTEAKQLASEVLDSSEAQAKEIEDKGAKEATEIVKTSVGATASGGGVASPEEIAASAEAKADAASEKIKKEGAEDKDGILDAGKADEGSNKKKIFIVIAIIVAILLFLKFRS
ncbi:MAG: hypothetical protein EPO42_14195 [Gallionellaceae bacterium]|nr:MAG: hypothetical protein EPO42_14195 [Gallionellaceae bacterium]